MANPVFDLLCPVLRNRFTWLPFYIVGGIYVLYKYKMQGLLLIIGAGLTILCCDQSANLLKHVIHRLRPCHLEPGVRLLVDHCSDTFSFPSNHATNHFGLSLFLALTLRGLRWLPPVVIGWAGAVAFAQVYVGIHYPADIAAGAVLGSMIGWGGGCLYRRAAVHLGHHAA